jgi:hypothetical protein
MSSMVVHDIAKIRHRICLIVNWQPLTEYPKSGRIKGLFPVLMKNDSQIFLNCCHHRAVCALLSWDSLYRSMIGWGTSEMSLSFQIIAELIHINELPT